MSDTVAVVASSSGTLPPRPTSAQARPQSAPRSRPASATKLEDVGHPREDALSEQQQRESDAEAGIEDDFEQSSSSSEEFVSPLRAPRQPEPAAEPGGGDDDGRRLESPRGTQAAAKSATPPHAAPAESAKNPAKTGQPSTPPSAALAKQDSPRSAPTSGREAKANLSSSPSTGHGGVAPARNQSPKAPRAPVVRVAEPADSLPQEESPAAGPQQHHSPEGNGRSTAWRSQEKDARKGSPDGQPPPPAPGPEPRQTTRDKNKARDHAPAPATVHSSTKTSSERPSPPSPPNQQPVASGDGDEAAPSPSPSLYVHRVEFGSTPKPPRAERWMGDVMGQNVFICGGVVQGKPSPSLYAFNAKTQAWKPLGSGCGSAKPSPSVGHTFTALRKNALVLIGGGNDAVFILDTNSIAWQRIGRDVSMVDEAWRTDRRDPCDRKHHTTVIHEGAAVVFGGITKLGKTNLIDRFSLTAPDKGSWSCDSTPAGDARPSDGVSSNATDVPPLSHHTAVVAENRMIVYGGKDAAGDHRGDVHVYEFSSRRFTAFAISGEQSTTSDGDEDVPCAPAPRYGHSAAMAPNGVDMLMYGGCTGPCAYSNELWSLDVMDFIWRRVEVEGAPAKALGLFAVFPAIGGPATAPAATDAAEGTPREGDSGASLFVYFGGGALPEAGGSKYAQLAFKASDEVLVFKNEPAEARPTTAAENDAATTRKAKPASKRPASAPVGRASTAAAPASRENEDGDGAESSCGGSRPEPAAANTTSKRPRKSWNLAGDFPPAPPVPNRTEPPRNISPKTIARLCPTKEDRDRKLDKLRDHVQPLYVSTAKRTPQQIAEAAERMSKKEMEARVSHALATQTKLMTALSGMHSPKRKVTSDDVAVLTHKLYKQDVDRFNRVHNDLAKKFGYTYTPRVVVDTPLTALNDRFYASRKDDADKVISKLRRKYLKDVPTKVLEPDQLQESIDRLTKPVEPRPPR